MVNPMEAPHSAFQPMSATWPPAKRTNLMSRLPQSSSTKSGRPTSSIPPRARAVSSLMLRRLRRAALWPVARSAEKARSRSRVATMRGPPSMAVSRILQ